MWTIICLILLGVAIIIASILVYGARRWQSATNDMHAKIEAARRPVSVKIYNSAELIGLPAPVQLRADALLREVPIILLTALDHRVSRLQGIEAGADDFISNPFDRSELQARVRPITRLKRYRSLLAECTRFERVVEHADDGYLLVGEAGDVEYANPRARLYLGLAADGDLTTALLPSG